MINLFYPEDFEEGYGRPDVCNIAAIKADAKLNAYVQCLEKVYGDMRLGSYHSLPILWTVDWTPKSTHSVRLIGVERLKTTDPK